MDKAEQEDQIESTKPLFPLLLLLMTSFTPRFRNLPLNLQIRKLSRLDGKKSSWSCLPPGGPTAAQLSSYLAGALRTRRPWMSRLAAAPHPLVLPPLWAAALLKLGSSEADRRSRTLGLGHCAEDGGPEAEAHWLGLAVWGADGGGREGGGQTGKDRRGLAGSG